MDICKISPISKGLLLFSYLYVFTILFATECMDRILSKCLAIFIINFVIVISVVPSIRLDTEYYQPAKRDDHSTIFINDDLYLWGGDRIDTTRVHNSPEKMRQTSCIEIFHLRSWSWEQQDTFGKPPLGVSGYACASIKGCIYYFGGWCGHDNHYHNSLYEMNVKSYQWKELFPTSYWVGPMRKARSGMVSFKCDFEDYLLVVGGIGLPPIVPNPYAKCESLYGEMRTNEVHIFDFSTGWQSDNYNNTNVNMRT